MRLIDTSGITASKGYPLLANNPNVVVGIDFIQQGLAELFAKCAQSVSPGGNPTILEGMALSGNNISAGGVYVPALGEIFIYNGGNISGSPNTYIACSWVPNPTDTSPYQTTLSDGSQVSVHNQRTLTFAYSSTPGTGNIADFGTWVQNQVSLNTQSINELIPEAWISMSYNNSWANYGNGYSNGRFRLEGDKLVLSGAIYGGASGTSVMIMSPGWQPTNKVTVAVPVYYAGAITMGYLTILPNGTLSITYPGSITFVSLDGISIALS